MNIVEETSALRRELAAQAARPEWALLARYDLLGGKPPSDFRDRVYRQMRKSLAATGLFPPRITRYPWRPSLKHAPRASNATTLLIWAFNVERARLRQACEGFSRRLQDHPLLAPVLVSNVADFAHFSRQGWLVEYLPEFTGEGPSYQERKRRYLAWRYRDALILPASAGWAKDAEWKTLMEASRR